MKFGASLLASAALVATAIGAAGSASATPSSDCMISGIVQGGGIVDSQNVSDRSGFISALDPHSNWLGGFGEGALAYGCNGWNVQLDGAYYSFATSVAYPKNNSQDYSGQTGHVGGDIYWREPDRFIFGLSGSRILRRYTDFGSAKKIDGAFWRGGAFGELYPNDQVTLGGGIYYFNGDLDFGTPGYIQSGFEGDIFAKYYATPNLSLSLRGDVTTTRYKFKDFFDIPMSGYAGTVQAEYLVPDTSLSLFTGARYASRTQTYESSGAWIRVEDLQAFAGLSFSFGGTPPSSLRDKDRHGPVDNTSVFNEKLPDFEMSGIKTIGFASP